MRSRAASGECTRAPQRPNDRSTFKTRSQSHDGSEPPLRGSPTSSLSPRLPARVGTFAGASRHLCRRESAPLPAGSTDPTHHHRYYRPEPPMTDTSPTASGSPARRGRVFQAGAAGALGAAARARREADCACGGRVVGGAAHHRAASRRRSAHPAPFTGPKGDVHAEVLVLGAGPGGYTAAFRAADLGRKSSWSTPAAPWAGSASTSAASPPKPCCTPPSHRRNQGDEPRRAHLRLPRPSTSTRCAAGRRRRQTAHRRPDRPGQTTQSPDPRRHRHFTSPDMLSVDRPRRPTTTVSFDAAIIAAGSEPVDLPFIPHDDPRVIDSTGALDLDDIPERLLVLGGGSSAWKWPGSTPNSAPRSASSS